MSDLFARLLSALANSVDGEGAPGAFCTAAALSSRWGPAEAERAGPELASREIRRLDTAFLHLVCIDTKKKKKIKKKIGTS